MSLSKWRKNGRFRVWKREEMTGSNVRWRCFLDFVYLHLEFVPKFINKLISVWSRFCCIISFLSVREKHNSTPKDEPAQDALLQTFTSADGVPVHR